MIAKKNSRLDLESKRSAFFGLGLLVTGSLTLAAFTYSDPMLRADAGNDVKPSLLSIVYEQTEIEKPKDQPLVNDVQKPEPLQTQPSIDIVSTVTDRIVAVSNTSQQIVSTAGIELGGFVTGPTINPNDGMDIIDPEIIDVPDVDATFLGGHLEMMRFIQSKMEYPPICLQAGEEGTVWLRFVIEPTGQVTNIEIERSANKDFDREAKRVIAESPNWIPGQVKAKKVRTRVRLPIVFQLN